MKSIQEIKEQLNINPNNAEAHWKYGCALAFSGNWEEAWDEIEWRFVGHKPTIIKRQKYDKPDWDGSETRLLIYQDQGFGDLFQYVRYVREITCPYILEVNAECYYLLKGQGFNVTVRNSPLPEYDQVVAVCSLPSYFRKFSPYNYLTAVKSGKLLVEGTNRKIGIAWEGNSCSCNPNEFSALAECGDLISLMIKKFNLPFIDFSLRIRDFADTSEVIDQLDYVVTIDTAVAHLAGAMGKPVYLILEYEHDWRWMANRADTPWYPTMKILRQPQKGDWKSVFDEIKKDILWEKQ